MTVVMLEWPEIWSDLNTVENLQSVVNRRLQNIQSNNADQLKLKQPELSWH